MPNYLLNNRSLCIYYYYTITQHTIMYCNIDIYLHIEYLGFASGVTLPSRPSKRNILKQHKNINRVLFYRYFLHGGSWSVLMTAAQLLMVAAMKGAVVVTSAVHGGPVQGCPGDTWAQHPDCPPAHCCCRAKTGPRSFSGSRAGRGIHYNNIMTSWRYPHQSLKRRFEKISQSRRRPQLGPSPG